MDPFLVTAIGSIGSKLIDRILPDTQTPAIDPTTLNKFSQLLNQIESSGNSELSAYLKENGIESWEDLENHLNELRGEIREKLDLQIGFNTDNANWMLNVTPEQIQLMSPQGDPISLDSIPGLAEMAQDFHQLNMLQVLHSQDPDASIQQVAGRFNSDTQPYITWNL